MSAGDSKKIPPGGSAGAPGAGKPAAPAAPAVARNQSGRVKFDERGNAIWEWAVATGAFGREISTERMRRLENGSLSLADEAPTPAAETKPGLPGGVKGYNPYDSSKPAAGAPAPQKRTDLKKLGEWLKLKQQVANKKDDE